MAIDWDATTNSRPEAEEAIETQVLLGALVCLHVWAKTELTIIKMANPGSSILKVFIERALGIHQCRILPDIDRN